MGTANIIPGVSGGTVAFVVGIYEELISAIKALDFTFARLLLTFKIREALSYIPVKFLLSIFSGALLSIILLSQMISGLLREHPVLTNAFFFGLIVATVPIIARVIKKWNWLKILTIAVACIVTYYFVGLVPLTTPNTFWMIFLSGILAISAMILPGISGAFVLLLLGKYQYILDAINGRDVLTLGILALGMVVGVLVSVRFLGYLFQKHHDMTLAVLTGFVMGSLDKIWPWKQTLESMTTFSGKIIILKEINFIPTQYSPEILHVMLLMGCGFGVALGLQAFKQ